MFSLFIVEVKRQWLIVKRYPVESLAEVLVFTLVFIGLFRGSKFLAGSAANFGSRLDLAVAGYVVWLVTIGLFAGPGSLLVDDARSGILEQLFICRLRFSSFAALRLFSGLILRLILIAIIGLVIGWVAGTHLEYRWVELLPFIGVIFAASGLGLLVAAYALLVKQVRAMLSVGQLLLLGLVFAPIRTSGRWGTWLSLITPINPAAQILQRQLAIDYRATSLQMTIALTNGFLYFVIGIYVLELASRRSRRRASIGVF